MLSLLKQERQSHRSYFSYLGLDLLEYLCLFKQANWLTFEGKLVNQTPPTGFINYLAWNDQYYVTQQDWWLTFSSQAEGKLLTHQLNSYVFAHSVRLKGHLATFYSGGFIYGFNFITKSLTKTEQKHPRYYYVSVRGSQLLVQQEGLTKPSIRYLTMAEEPSRIRVETQNLTLAEDIVLIPEIKSHVFSYLGSKYILLSTNQETQIHCLATRERKVLLPDFSYEAGFQNGNFLLQGKYLAGLNTKTRRLVVVDLHRNTEVRSIPMDLPGQFVNVCRCYCYRANGRLCLTIQISTGASYSMVTYE